MSDTLRLQVYFFIVACFDAAPCLAAITPLRRYAPCVSLRLMPFDRSLYVTRTPAFDVDFMAV